MDGKRTRDGGWPIDGSREKRAISSNKDALLSLWFHSINLCHLGIGVCKNDQGMASKDKADGADEGDGADRASKTNGCGADGAGKTNGCGADTKESNRVDRVDGAGRSEADAEAPDRADGVDGADGADGVDGANGADGGDGADGVDSVDGGGADAEEPGDPRDLGLGDPRAEEQKVARRAVTRLSPFPIRIVFCLFFSSFELETCGFV